MSNAGRQECEALPIIIINIINIITLILSESTSALLPFIVFNK